MKEATTTGDSDTDPLSRSPMREMRDALAEVGLLARADPDLRVSMLAAWMDGVLSVLSSGPAAMRAVTWRLELRWMMEKMRKGDGS